MRAKAHGKGMRKGNIKTLDVTDYKAMVLVVGLPNDGGMGCLLLKDGGPMVRGWLGMASWCSR